MRNIGNFLLGLLWAMAVTLGATFWFGMRFGFNLFSAQHWRYLGELQATHTPITTHFYIALAVFAAILLIGLYFILRPRFRKIDLDIRNKKQETSFAIQTPISTQETHHSSPITHDSPVRPPRLNLPTPSHKQVTTPTIAPVINQKLNFDDIFTDAGFVVKKQPRIAGWTPVLFAIGTNEALWIGGDTADIKSLNTAVERMRAIFTETLEDIEININAFTVGGQTADGDIMNFADTDELRAYMNEHKNVALDDSERDDFDAYSEYIDTVANYFNRL